jgi:S-DNA-T family DNA segregation ATPase FtsK/SpoIIIE
LERVCHNRRKELGILPLVPKPSQFEVNKALKPTISHSSEINLDPVSK